RHRLLWLCLADLDLPGAGTSVLHFAPESALAARLRARANEYVSVDLEAGRGGVQADITSLPFPGETFDLVICSHVLEHVQDGRAAMSEMFRVLRSGAVALIQTPV